MRTCESRMGRRRMGRRRRRRRRRRPIANANECDD